MDKQKQLENAHVGFRETLERLKAITAQQGSGEPLKDAEKRDENLKTIPSENIDPDSILEQSLKELGNIDIYQTIHLLKNNTDWIFNIPIERIRKIEDEMREILLKEYSKILIDGAGNHPFHLKGQYLSVSTKNRLEYKNINSQNDTQTSKKEHLSFIIPVKDESSNDLSSTPIEPQRSIKNEINEYHMSIFSELRTRITNRRDEVINFSTIKYGIERDTQLILVNIYEPYIILDDQKIIFHFLDKLSDDLKEYFDRDFKVYLNFQNVDNFSLRFQSLRIFLQNISQVTDHLEKRLEALITYNETQILLDKSLINKKYDRKKLLDKTQDILDFIYEVFGDSYHQALAISFFFDKFEGILSLFEKRNKIFIDLKSKNQNHWYYLKWIEQHIE